MIEVHARPLRAVYLAGEIVECRVVIRNVVDSQSQSRSNAADEVIAWSSAQIHCLCTTNGVVKIPVSRSREEIATASQDTSFVPCKGENGHVVLSTKPRILFCDLKLRAGESKSFMYREIIPLDAPPSYRGHGIKYAYKISIGTQKIHSPIKLLKIPIRILVMQGLSEANFQPENGEAQVKPTNPFLDPPKRPSSMEVVMEAVDVSTARKSPSYYNITNQNGKVARVSLLKSSYRLGEDIIGLFDFSDATSKCVQFSVTLMSEEVFKEDQKEGAKPGSSTMSYNKQHEFCLYMLQTQMILPIPLTVTPTFSTDIVSLKWSLHFEFVTTNPLPPSSEPTSPSESVVWRGPEKLDVQTMVWDLPISIYPTHPMQVAYGMPTKLEHMIRL